MYSQRRVVFGILEQRIEIHFRLIATDEVHQVIIFKGVLLKR